MRIQNKLLVNYQKKIFFFLLLFLLKTNLFSQSCPQTIKSITVYEIQFNIGLMATTDTNLYPNNIEILASDGITNITYDKGTPFEDNGYNIVPYHNPSPEPWEGTEININNFTVDFGTGACNYENLTLPVDDYNYLNKNLTIFPTVLTNDKILFIQFSTQLTSTIKIFNSIGQPIKSIENNTKNNLDIVLDDFNYGVYYVKIKTDKGTATQKIIIAN